MQRQGEKKNAKIGTLGKNEDEPGNRQTQGGGIMCVGFSRVQKREEKDLRVEMKDIH
jgi:hypothetical protein